MASQKILMAGFSGQHTLGNYSQVKQPTPSAESRKTEKSNVLLSINLYFSCRSNKFGISSFIFLKTWKICTLAHSGCDNPSQFSCY